MKQLYNLIVVLVVSFCTGWWWECAVACVPSCYAQTPPPRSSLAFISGSNGPVGAGLHSCVFLCQGVNMWVTVPNHSGQGFQEATSASRCVVKSLITGGDMLPWFQGFGATLVPLFKVLCGSGAGSSFWTSSSLVVSFHFCLWGEKRFCVINLKKKICQCFGPLMEERCRGST